MDIDINFVCDTAFTCFHALARLPNRSALFRAVAPVVHLCCIKAAATILVIVMPCTGINAVVTVQGRTYVATEVHGHTVARAYSFTTT